MKWIVLIGIGFFIGGCTSYTQEVVEYRQVLVTPVVPATGVVSYGVYGIQEPLDVTTTTVEYY
ncbi:MAG: hypothetical protein WC627_03115 [Legionella sp.]|jgi:hypothetical protein